MFNFWGSDGTHYVRRPKNKRYDSTYAILIIKYVWGYVMLWGAYSGKRVCPLVKICGKMKDTTYKDIVQNDLLHYWRNFVLATIYLSMMTTQKIYAMSSSSGSRTK